MALGMKHWIGITVGGCALVGLWLLPPRSFATASHTEITSVERRANELEADARRTRLTLTRMRWSDSLSALALSTATNGVAFGARPAFLTAKRWTSARRVLEAEVAGLPRRDGDAVVGYFIQPAGTLWKHESLRRWNWEDLYMGSRDGHPYCFRVNATSSPRTTSSEIIGWSAAHGESYAAALGPCRYVAAYGLPGPAVLAWLGRGGTAYGQLSGAPSEQQLYWQETEYLPRVFGRRYHLNGREDANGDACRAGETQACVSIFLDPVSWLAGQKPVSLRAAGQRVEVMPAAITWPPLGVASAFLLSDLEKQFGPESFQAFWTSKQDVPAAFETAFGQPLDRWLMGWVSTHLKMTTAGPRLAGGDVLGLLAILVLGAMAGGFWAGRRKVA